MQIEYVPTVSRARAILETLTEDELAIDLETYVMPEYKSPTLKAVDPHRCKISLMSVSSRTNTYVFDILVSETQECFEDFKKELTDCLQNLKYQIVFNGAFEARFLYKFLGVWFFNFWDVMIASDLISNATGSKFHKSVGSSSLAACCYNWLGIHLTGKGTLQNSDWSIRPDANEINADWWRTKVEYNAGDTVHLHKLKDMMSDVLFKPLPNELTDVNSTDWGLGMKEITELEMEAVTVFAQMQLHGLAFSTDMDNQFSDELMNKKTKTGLVYKIGGELCTKLGLATEMTMFGTYPIPTKGSMKKLNSAVVLKNIILKMVGIDLDNAQAHVISRMVDLLDSLEKTNEVDFVDADEEEIFGALRELEHSAVVQSSAIAKLILEYKTLFKQATMKLNKYVNPVTGRIHSGYLQCFAATGRTSSQSPNGQNVAAKVKVLVQGIIDKLFHENNNSKPAREL